MVKKRDALVTDNINKSPLCSFILKLLTRDEIKSGVVKKRVNIVINAIEKWKVTSSEARE